MVYRMTYKRWNGKITQNGNNLQKKIIFSPIGNRNPTPLVGASSIVIAKKKVRIQNDPPVTLNNPFSYACWEARPNRRGDVVVYYSEETDNEVIFRAIFQGVTAGNADAARIIANALILGLGQIYKDIGGRVVDPNFGIHRRLRTIRLWDQRYNPR